MAVLLFCKIVKTKYEFGTGRDRLVPLLHISAGR